MKTLLQRGTIDGARVAHATWFPISVRYGRLRHHEECEMARQYAHTPDERFLQRRRQRADKLLELA